MKRQYDTEFKIDAAKLSTSKPTFHDNKAWQINQIALSS